MKTCRFCKDTDEPYGFYQKVRDFYLPDECKRCVKQMSRRVCPHCFGPFYLNPQGRRQHVGCVQQCEESQVTCGT